MAHCRFEQQNIFEKIKEAQPGYFDFQFKNHGERLGDFLISVKIGEDYSEGEGKNGDDYWHHWIKNSTLSKWSFSEVGFTNRPHNNGSWDGWIFNSTASPRLLV